MNLGTGKLFIGGQFVGDYKIEIGFKDNTMAFDTFEEYCQKVSTILGFDVTKEHLNIMHYLYDQQSSIDDGVKYIERVRQI